MNETNKMPFEPIPMPGMPEMPALPEMPRPSFSRTSTPPLPRRPLMIEDDKPNPFLLPQGIAAEVPAPTPAPVSSPGGWLRPSRAKGVVLAGLGSLGIGAFGLNALFPMPERAPSKVNALADNTPTATKPAAPRVLEERPGEEPGLLPQVILEKNDDPWNKSLPVPIVRVGDTTIPALPIPPLVVPKPEPLPVPVPISGALPAPALPGFEDQPRIKVPEMVELPPVKIEVPPLKETPLPLPIFTPTREPKLPVLIPAPETKLPPVAPLPIPDLKPPPGSEPARTNIEIKPFRDHQPEPKALPVPGELPKTIATVDAKTDYDVDIHKLRAGDSYAAISQKFYGSAGYAIALRGYNDNAELTRLRDVQVPPIHIIKRFSGADTPRIIPAGVLQDPGLVTPPPLERDVEWGTPGARKTEKPKSGEPVWR